MKKPSATDAKEEREGIDRRVYVEKNPECRCGPT